MCEKMGMNINFYRIDICCLNESMKISLYYNLVISKEGMAPRATAATMGKLVYMGLSDRSVQCGGAMAPAAVDSIEAHFRSLQHSLSYYDLIVTGDGRRVGHAIVTDIISAKGKHSEYWSCSCH